VTVRWVTPCFRIRQPSCGLIIEKVLFAVLERINKKLYHHDALDFDMLYVGENVMKMGKTCKVIYSDGTEFL
jgi:hypothetical protein